MPLGAAADHDGLASRFRHHSCRRRAVDDVPIADDRNRYGLDNRLDFLPIGLAAVKLIPRPAVDGNGSGTGIFSPFCQFRRHEGSIIPARAHLDGDGNGHGLYDGAYNFFGQGQILHQRRTVAIFDDLLYRAAHIDVDDIGAGFFDDSSRLGHDFRIRTENLHR